ncbi:MAG: 4Fe-4S ferredoxin [Clostridiales bacterium]|nr:4Fe-4S ferredoxin [Clostridiales bacterium]
MHAVRNIRLCTKDCLCLYVCPTGATDTETGQIDPKKCLSGCRVCVDACPSHAISLVPEIYPPQQEKTSAVVSAMRALSASKAEQERLFAALEQAAPSPEAKQFARAMRLSNRLMAEDLLREAGYLLPQSKHARELLARELNAPQDADFPKDAVKRLLELL